jgi:hypothetical protein
MKRGDLEMSLAPDFITIVEDTVARWRSYRARARTRRIVSSLPRHLRKDIGWPDASLPDGADPRWR